MARMTKATPQFLERYQDWMAGKLAAMDQEVEDRRRVQSDTNRLTTTTRLGEAQKAAWAETPRVCLLIGYSVTGGWHPGSSHCARCTVAPDCRRRLPVHVLRRREDARSG